MNPAGERVSEEERERLVEEFEVAIVEREAAADNYGAEAAQSDSQAYAETLAAYHESCDRVAQARASLLRTSSARLADLEAISRDIVADGAWFTAETPSELADRFRAILARHLAPTSDTEVESQPPRAHERSE